MRHEPLRVGRVAVEPAADLVVHAARRHLLQGQACHLERLWVPRAAVVAEEKADRETAGELGCPAQAAVGPVEAVAAVAERLLERAGIGKFVSGRSSGEPLADGPGDLAARL